MKQLAQKLQDGRPEVVDVSTPIVSRGVVLVQNAYSVISGGTEGSTVRAARKGLIGKARERPQQAKQMLSLLRQAGPLQAYRTATKKLDSYSPLGYSCAGFVVGIGEGVSGFSLGDKVACGGAGHSELVVVSENLCVKLDPDADLRLAAYNTLGAIALQGVRQADLRLGEACAVIGLGLLGQLTALLLKAGGIKVIGIDISREMVGLAQAHAADLAAERRDVTLPGRIDELTSGIGLDAVIITAATDSTDPVNFAGEILRPKGRVIIVGDVPTGFDREPYFYRKELDLRMSRSYGPGRYDPIYEEKGIDYPPGYVRWTERRNMEAFQDFVHRRTIDIDYLTTHVFGLDQSPAAYDLILDRTEPYLGILIEYSREPSVQKKVVIRDESLPSASDEVGIAFIGAGSYAMSHLLPNLPRENWIRRRVVMTSSGLSSRSVAERFKFEVCTSDEDDILRHEGVNTVFVATRHNTHAEYALNALRANKHVFVEKPLCLTETQLVEIEEEVAGQSTPAMLMVGFNRRFSPLTRFVRERIGPGPMLMTYRINAGSLAEDSWIKDPDVGGGRIIGEVCHFVDLLTFYNGSLPTKIQTFGMPAVVGRSDTVVINLAFQNGSVGTIAYCENGAKGLPKEYVEIHSRGEDCHPAEISGRPKSLAQEGLRERN